MTIVNRRNAVVGWLALKVWKGVARREAKQALGRLGSRRRKSGG